MSRRRRTWRCAVSFVSLAMSLVSAEARADGRDYHESVPEPTIPRWLSIPFEFGNSAAWSQRSPHLGYQYRLGVLPGVAGEWWRFHAVLEAVYRNPDVDASLGLRPVVRLFPIPGGGGFASIHLLAEATYMPVTSGRYAGAGLMLGVGRLLYLAGLYGRDDRSTNFIGVRLGVDLTTLGDPIGALISDVPQTRP